MPPPPTHRRMLAVMLTSAGFYACTSGIEVLLPLWGTGPLGLTAADWAHLRALRFCGALAGVIVLGALADRYGQRRVGMLAMMAAGGVIAALGLPARLALWLLMPVLGALLSTCFVTLNTLTQEISDRRQGLANSIYRGVGTAVSIPAPLLATWLTHGSPGYSGAFAIMAVIIGLSGLALLLYPATGTSPAFQGWRTEWVHLAATYRGPLRNRPLLKLIGISLLWHCCLVAPATFGAIRLVRQLGLPEGGFGLSCAVAALGNLALTVLSAITLDRLPLRPVITAGAVTASLGCVLMGATNAVAPTVIGFVVSGATLTTLFSPLSMWVSRAAGPRERVGAFALHKVCNTACFAIALALHAALEPRLGIRLILLGSGTLGTLLALGFLTLREPAHPDTPDPIGVADPA